MSTRSCIAQKDGDGSSSGSEHRWRGIYHHSDGYPSGLGCYIFRLIRREFNGNAGGFLEWALSHDGGWSHIFPSGVAGAHPQGGDTIDLTSPRPECYCHGYYARRDHIRPGQKKGVITGCQCAQKPYISGENYEPSCDPLSIEWVYVLDPQARTMTVLEAYGEDIPGTVGWVEVRLDGTREVHPKRAYRHRLSAVVELAQRYIASVESAAIHYVTLADVPCAVVWLQPDYDDDGFRQPGSPLKVRYQVRSPSFPFSIRPGTPIPLDDNLFWRRSQE